MNESAQTILVAGAGIVGLAMAASLKASLGDDLRVIVCDPQAGASPEPEGRRHLRVSAIAEDARRLLQDLGAWELASHEAAPVHSMELTESEPGAPAPSPLMTLHEIADEGAPLAHIAPNAVLNTALRRVAADAGVEVWAVGIDRWAFDGSAAGGRGAARLSDGRSVMADLLLAADGARSRLRALAGIGWHGWGYGQSGLVATIAHTRPHKGRATQHFLPSGPFAILPLTGNRSSIVWSERDAEVAHIRRLDRVDVLDEIRRRFRLDRGELTLVHYPVGVFPLSLGVARRFAAPGLALIGDAAHQVHPIAGQGLNLGLRDVIVLAGLIADAVRIGLPASDWGMLQEYERQRRPDVMTFALAFDAVNRIFSNDIAPLRTARTLGARIMGALPGVNDFMVRTAGGLR